MSLLVQCSHNLLECFTRGYGFPTNRVYMCLLIDCDSGWLVVDLTLKNIGNVLFLDSVIIIVLKIR